MRRAMVRVLASLTRRKLRRTLRRDPRVLTTIESTLIAMRGMPRNCEARTLHGPLFSFLRRIDPEAFFRALARVHRVAVRDLEEPVWRRYMFGGAELVHDIRNTAEWASYIMGEHDGGVRYWVHQRLGRGDVAIDIGANVGIFTHEMARLVGKSGRVIGFEHNPYAIHRLHDSLEHNGLLENVQLHQLALSDTTGRMQLTIPPKNSGAASLDRIESENAEVIEVPVERFSDWWNHNGRPPASLIKIDVEGFELPVVKGMAGYLADNKPMLLIEVTPRNRLPDTLELLAMMEELGYEVRQIINRPPYVLPLPKSLPKQLDILCVAESGASPARLEESVAK